MRSSTFHAFIYSFSNFSAYWSDWNRYIFYYQKGLLKMWYHVERAVRVVQRQRTITTFHSPLSTTHKSAAVLLKKGCRRGIWSTVVLDGTQLPRHKRRYRNAFLSLGFVAVVLAISEYITSNYLKSSTPYRHSLEQIQRSSEVQGLLGMPIVAGLTVSSKRNMSYFRLTYSVHGPLGSADVEVTTVTSLKNATLLCLVVMAKERTIVLVDNKEYLSRRL
jgi:hypothetical protein